MLHKKILPKKYLFLLSWLCVNGLLLQSCKTVGNKPLKQEMLNFSMDEISVVANPTYKGSATKTFQIKHTRLELKPLWAEHALDGLAEITLSSYAYAQDTLVLDAKSFSLQSVELLEDKITKRLSYIYDKQKIHIALGRTYKPIEEIRIRIKYIAKPENQYADGFLKNKSDQGLYFIDPEDKDPYLPKQLWSQGEVKNNCAWFPTIDEPNQKFTQEIFLT
ncbi:MAG: hypothetical protein EOP53_10110, partial [Sphingobacteriales bacterium]